LDHAPHPLAQCATLILTDQFAMLAVKARLVVSRELVEIVFGIG
jgi:hypothetical protein